MDKTISLGAAYTIGTYILPGEPITQLKKILNSKIKIKTLNCDEIIEGVINKDFDFGLIESPIFVDGLAYKKWMEDELVFCSKVSLGENVDADMISRCQLLCRIEDCPTRQFISDIFSQHGLSYTSFESLMQIDNSISRVQGIKWSKPDRENPTVAIVSEYAIQEELERKELYVSSILGKRICRDFYLVYLENHPDAEKYEEVAAYLKNWYETNLSPKK